MKMNAYDFMYDNRNLSEFGLIVCQFDPKGIDIISNGAKITFNTVPVFGGSKNHLTSTVYEDCLEATIQVCKHSCTGGVKEITPIEFRELTRWLCRKKFLKFKPLSEEYIDLYFEASFNVNRIEMNGKIYGLELEVVTNRPFALKEPKTTIIRNTVESGGMKRIHTWKKYTAIENTIVGTFVDNLEIGRILNIGDIRFWSIIEYADKAIVVDKEISLVNPIEVTATKDKLVGVVEEKYMYTGYNSKYIRMTPESEITTNSSSTSATNVYVLSVGDLKDDYIEDVTSEDENAYPENGVKDGYYYVYVDNHIEQGKKSYINDTSYEEGYIYPYTEITIVEDGDLNIYNAIEDRNTYIANCVAGEVITMDYPIIKSSVSSHNIQNDFNWNFFRIANTYNNSRNDLTISIQCVMKVTYSPIVKVGL
jgi:hypothetical protein